MEVRIGQYVQAGMSFGIAEYQVDGQTIDELLYAAAIATRTNKAERKKTNQNSTPRLTEKTANTIALADGSVSTRVIQ